MLGTTLNDFGNEKLHKIWFVTAVMIFSITLFQRKLLLSRGEQHLEWSMPKILIFTAGMTFIAAQLLKKVQ